MCHKDKRVHQPTLLIGLEPPTKTKHFKLLSFSCGRCPSSWKHRWEKGKCQSSGSLVPTRNMFLHKGNIMQKTPNSSWNHPLTHQFQAIPVSHDLSWSSWVQLAKEWGICSSTEAFMPLVLPITKPEMPILLGHLYWRPISTEICQKYLTSLSFYTDQTFERNYRNCSST